MLCRKNLADILGSIPYGSMIVEGYDLRNRHRYCENQTNERGCGEMGSKVS